MSTNKRIRGRTLQTIRAYHFARNPLCVHCLKRGIIRPWTQLDHNIPVDKGGDDTDENRQGLCEDCHRVKTSQDQGYKVKPVIGPDGYPVTE